MGGLNRDKLVKLNYWVIGVLLFVALFIVINVTSPEKMIVGDWEEVGWFFEKPDATITEDRFDDILHEEVRKKIMDDMKVLHVERWRFSEDGRLTTEPDSSHADLQWFIKGSGHILELRRDGKTLENFEIKRLDREELELHLMLDLQLKGVVRILLKRIQED